MCGVSGITTPDRDLVLRMSHALSHRGPDASDVFVDDRVAIAHERLRIIDLSDGGAQPRVHHRHVLSFNGEIYNYIELRKELESEGVAFETRSDTEVFLRAYERWGVECFGRFNGMWAAAIYDRKDGSILLSRDRLGQKPLYYVEGRSDSEPGLAFASQIRALQQLGELDTRRVEALAEYFTYGFVPEPATWFERIRAVPAAHHVRWRPGAGLAAPERYWTLEGDLARPAEADLIDELDSLLTDALRLRQRADVPVGLFVSGGLDSTGIASLLPPGWTGLHVALDAAETRLVRSFARDSDARLVVRTAREYDYDAELPRIMREFDQPFADNSSIPTYWICREAAAQGLKVMLSGEGGDELFFGYERYGRLRLFEQIGNRSWVRAMHAFSERVSPGGSIEKGLRFLGKHSLRDYYLKLRGGFTPDEWPRLFMPEYLDQLRDFDPYEPFEAHWPDRDWPIAKCAQWFDWATNFPCDILAKVDRMSMAHSLEVRSPFLDHRLYEWAARLHPDVLFAGESKRLYKRWLRPRIPRRFLNQPKRGFGLNVDVDLAERLPPEIRPGAREWLAQEKKIFFANALASIQREN